MRISISRIFKWYAKDFEAGGGIVAFLERYGTPAVVSKIRSSRDKVKLAYQKYDWRLNAAP